MTYFGLKKDKGFREYGTSPSLNFLGETPGFEGKTDGKVTVEIPLLQFSMISSVGFQRKSQKAKGQIISLLREGWVLSTAKISYQRN